jgi:hypothetical protein
MIKPFISHNVLLTLFLEKKIAYMKKCELLRIDGMLIDMEFSVAIAFRYYKLVRSIEGEKKAGVRIMRAINQR